MVMIGRTRDRGGSLVLAAALAIAAGDLAMAGGPEGGLIAIPGGPDEVGGYASTHVLIHLHPGVEAGVRPDGRLGLTRANRGGLRPAGLALAEDALADLLQEADATGFDDAYTVQPANPGRAAALGMDRTRRLNVPHGTDTAALVAQLAQFEDHIELAEVDGIGGIAATIPNDTLFDSQYGMLNTGQTIVGWAGVPGADVNATNAWDITTGDASLILAVLDAGMDNHDDFVGRAIPGWNVVSNNGDTSDICISHGTHVAGIAAANGNNALGVAGMDWNVKIMPVRVLNGCSGSESSLASGLMWAADNGADVINMSLQYTTGTTTLHNAVIYARDAGVVLVAAAGNNNGGIVRYPGRWPETIAVSAMNNRENIWSGSSVGPEVTVTAPGEDVLSCIGADSYNYYDGTSMASPHVAGLACLMLAVEPTLTHDDIRDLMIGTAVDIGAPGFDNLFGNGLIDAAAAVDAAINGLPVPGDTDGDGIVGILDLLTLLGSWGACPADPDPCPADFDGSGSVDILDLLTILGNWTG